MATHDSHLRIGFIGLDTSHVSAFSKLLNDPANEHHVRGGRVVAGFPGGSPDFPLSINRVAGFTEELKERYNVEILTTPEAVAERVDLVFILSCDGRVHRPMFERVARFRKPTFIDKPLATRSEDAKAILDLAQREGIALLSSSSLRYSQGLNEALAGGVADIRGVDIYGPLAEEPTQPGLFWYGCHSVEMMVRVMGVGCTEVRCVRSDNNDLAIASWSDGRIASIRGNRNAHGKFGLTLHREAGPEHVDASAGRPYYAGLLDAIMTSLPQGKWAISREEMLHVVRIIEAINESRAKGGAAIAV